MSARRRVVDALFALSLANVLMLEPWSRVLLAEAYYLGRPRIRADYLGAMLATLVLAALLFGIARLARRAKSERVLRLARTLAALSLAVPAFALARALLEDTGLEHGIAWARTRPGFTTAALAAFAVAVGLAVWFRRAAWWLVRALILVLLPFALLTFGQSVAGAIRSPARARTGPGPCPRTRTARGAQGPRVVWLILDELDQRVALEARPAGLSMPALDRLRGEALVATQAYPPARETMLSLPALTTGARVEQVQVGAADELWLKREGAAAFERWRPDATVFGRVRAMGLRTRLAGWAHAYCQVLGPSLDSCVTQPSYYVITGELEHGTVIETATEQLLSLMPWDTRRLHEHAYDRLLDEARVAASRGDPGLAFVHLPVPHLPAIYSRARGRRTWWNFREVRGYVDNLALADQAIGAIRAAMDQAGTWRDANVIVSADHPWRDSRSFDRVSDARVPFLVKLAGQAPASGREYRGAFDTVVTQALVLAILAGEVRTPEDLERWLDARVQAAPIRPAGEHAGARPRG